MKLYGIKFLTRALRHEISSYMCCVVVYKKNVFI
jgi:hypothetical protein